MITPASIGLPPKFTSFREEVRQLDIILDILSAPTRFVVAQIPPGIGKTVVYMSVQKILQGRGANIIPTKGLQGQLLRDFPEMVDIRGHGNYSCAQTILDDEGQFLDVECRFQPKECLFNRQCEICSQSQFVSTNSALWIQLEKAGQSNKLGPFDIVTFDEAHLLKGRLVDSLSLTLTDRLTQRYLERDLPNLTTTEQWQDWIGHCLPILTEKKETLLDLLRLNQSRSTRKDFLTVNRLLNQFERIKYDAFADWLVYKDKSYRAKFVPLDIRQYSERYLWKGIGKIVLVSATIFKSDANELGIPEEDMTWMEVSNPFPINRRLVYYFPSDPAIKVDSKMSQGERIIWQRHNDRIVSGFLGQGITKGIIQSRSYGRSLDIVSQSVHSDIMLSHQPGAAETERAILDFKRATEPTILVSPSIEEGVDFPHNECRFVLIPKVPFLDLRDPVTAAMHQRSKDYANREVVRTITQMCLRAVRAMDDWCLIVITDKHWSWFRRNNLFFRWFSDAFRNTTEVPKFEEGRAEPIIMRAK